MEFLAPLAVALFAAALGFCALRLGGPGAPPLSLPLAFACGLLAIHIVLLFASVVGLPWSWIPLAALLVLAAAALWLQRARSAERRGSREHGNTSDRFFAVSFGLGWGDCLALAAIAIFAWHAATLKIPFPDFIYHWGLKGEKFYLAHGLDLDFLTAPSAWRSHPDYPNLLPELHTLTAMALGRWEAAPMQLWSALFLAAIVGAGGESLRRAEVGRWLAQAGVALLALVLAAFGIGLIMGGSADWLIAFGLVLAAPALCGAVSVSGDVTVGVAAAFVASSKIEGVPLGAFLIAVQLVRGGWHGVRASLVRLGRCAGPWILVVVPWLLFSLRHHLFLASNTGSFDSARGSAILPATWETLRSPAWHGWTAALALLPWLLYRPRTRALATVCCLQLAFNFAVYFTGPVDTRFYVLATFPRLVLHVLPAILVGVLMELGLPLRRGEIISPVVILSAAKDLGEGDAAAGAAPDSSLRSE